MYRLVMPKRRALLRIQKVKYLENRFRNIQLFTDFSVTKNQEKITFLKKDSKTFPFWILQKKKSPSSHRHYGCLFRAKV